MKKLLKAVFGLLVLGIVGLLPQHELQAQVSVNHPCNPPSFLNQVPAGSYRSLSPQEFSHLTYVTQNLPFATSVATVTILSPIGEGYTTGPLMIFPWEKEVVVNLRTPGGSKPVGQLKLCSRHDYGNGPRLVARAVVFGTQIIPFFPSECGGPFDRCFAQFERESLVNRGR